MHASSLNRRHLLQTAAALATVGAWPVRAAVWPDKPVRLVIPFPAGGATDYAARAIGSALAERWSQPVVFDNRAGAGSTLGTAIGAKSAPDGYTLVMGIPAGVSIAPHIYPKLAYHPLTDWCRSPASRPRRWCWWCRPIRPSRTCATCWPTPAPTPASWPMRRTAADRCRT